jgi:hypothetical protein
MRESGWYPAGAEFDANAPYNEPYVPEKEFDITCSQSLSRTATVWTDNYIPGASGVDYEPDDEGGYYASGWQDPDDTSDTNWGEEYKACGHYTPLQLIQLYKETLKEQLKSWEGLEDSSTGKNEIRRIEHLIEECDCWSDDETEYIVED